MNKTKAKKKSRKKEQSKNIDVIDIKEYFLQKVESLSWDMGKKINLNLIGLRKCIYK